MRFVHRLVIGSSLVAFIAMVGLSGCGGGGDLTRGYSARCSDGQLDFGTSCGTLCFGHGTVTEYYQKCR